MSLALTVAMASAAPMNDAARIVAASNAAGLHAFASATGDESARDITVGPALTWYLHEALRMRHHDAATTGIVSDLWTDGASLTGQIFARSNLKSYTQKTADSERSTLGIKTEWGPPTTDRSAAYDTFALSAQIEANFMFSPAGDVLPYRQEESFVRENLRGFRIDDDRGAVTLYIFTDTAARLDALRQSINTDVWSQLTSDFHPNTGVLSDLWIDESSSHLENVPYDEAYQLKLGCPFPDYVEERFHTTYSSRHFTYTGTVRAESDDDGSNWAAEAAVRRHPVLGSMWSPIASGPGVHPDICRNGDDLFGGLRSVGSGLSARVPMTYALVDHRTEMIIMLAAHTM